MREIVSDVNSDTIHHHDLGKSRILKDEEHVESVVELLDKEWINPFDSFPMKITQLSSGREVSDEVQTNLLEMKEKGTSAYEDFKRNRLEQSIGFFDPIKRTPNLDFKECNSKNKPPKNLTVVGSDSHIFGKMILIAENRQLDLEEIFQYPLGPLPWSLANHDGSLKKTNKAVLAKFLEGKTERQAECSVSSATIIDGMALLHKINGDGHTFDEISKIILSHILQTTSTRIDVVFDDYRSESIKSSERNKRGDKEGLRFQNFKGGQKINAWKKLLLSGDNKKTLCKFLAESWTTSERRCLLEDKILFVTRGKECIKITQTDSTVIPELYSTHEEADTRMMVHIKHASSKHKTIICIADDTDVLVICIYAAQFIDETCNILVKRGRKHQSRFINVRDIISKIGNNVANSLISLHAFTGCDSVSAFAGRGKLKALSLLSSSSEFQDTFSHIGSDWTLSSDCFKSIERFVTQLYCKGTEINSVNALRNHIFRVKQGAVRSDELPPCKNSLLQHSLRANYQAAVWRRCLRTCPEVPSPDNHGWEIKNKEIKIIWMTCLPAPAAVMELLSCKCSISCTLPRCSCLANGLKCSTSCKSQECDNMFKYEEEEEIFDRGGMNSDSEDDDM